jgi:hypothetical protein
MIEYNFGFVSPPLGTDAEAAWRYMDSTSRESLGTNFFVAGFPLKTGFLTLNTNQLFEV